MSLSLASDRASRTGRFRIRLIAQVVFLAQVGVICPALATNGLIAATWNQLTTGRFCQQVTASEVKAAGYECRISPTVRGLSDSADGILERLVFEEAAHKQIKSDQCLAEALGSVHRDDEKFARYKSVLLATWVGFKKAELTRSFCARNFWNHLAKSDIKKYGLRKAFEKYESSSANQDLPQQTNWRAVCLDEQSAAALRQAKALFSYALPLLSHQGLFTLIERRRQQITNTATGSALTDEEIMSFDLRDNKAMAVRADAEFDRALHGFLSSHQVARAKVANRLAAQAQGAQGLQSLSAQAKDYLFEQGAVSEVLLSRGLMKLDEKDEPVAVTPGAACILAWHKPTLSGELVDLAGSFLIPGGVLYKVLGASQRFSQVSKLARFKTALLWSGVATSVAPIAKQIQRNCFSGLGAAARLRPAKSDDPKVAEAAANLPGAVAYERWNFEFEATEIPSCSAGEGPNYLVNHAYAANCTREFLLLLLPPTIGIPYLIVS